jgi:hypothetical protein
MDIQLFVSSDLDISAEHMDPISNKDYFNKPHGGLWTSTYRPETHDSGWVEWCHWNDFGDVDSKSWYLLTPKADPNIYTIRSLDDLCRLLQEYSVPLPRPGFERHYLDFEALSKVYDGIHLTQEGQMETHLSFPENLYGWDCESTLWFGWHFERVEKIERVKA